MSRFLQDYLARAADRWPEGVALVDGDVCVSFLDLQVGACRFASLVRAAGCEWQDRVCIVLPKSAEAIIAILGALNAGCIYVPIDSAAPPARNAKILRTCEPACIVALAGNRALIEEAFPTLSERQRVSVIWLDGSLPPTAGFRREFLFSDAGQLPLETHPTIGSADQIAYVLFTSGSTGFPKGAMITHDNVRAFLDWAVPHFGIQPGERLSGHPPLYFDLSVLDIFGSLAAKAELHLVPKDFNLAPALLTRFMREHRLTQWFSAPSALSFIAHSNLSLDFPHLRRVLWCGEVLPTSTLIYWMRQLPRVEFTNLYGPTETTIASSYFTVPSCPADPCSPIPIGTACEGEMLFVLDQQRHPVAPGGAGEMWISGAGLSRGYWHDTERTCAAFVDLQLPERMQPLRAYRTGDLARLGEDGLFYFLGRADSQIKHRGHRIELGEIEAALSALSDLRESAVIAISTNDFAGNAICCAYVCATNKALGPQALRTHLQGLLPSYMLPSRWMQLDAFPRNANGKVDRPALKKRFAESYEQMEQRAA